MGVGRRVMNLRNSKNVQRRGKSPEMKVLRFRSNYCKSKKYLVSHGLVAISMELGAEGVSLFENLKKIYTYIV